MSPRYWRAVVTFKSGSSWQHNGFLSKEAAEKAAQVHAGKKQNNGKVSGWRAEPE